MQLKGFSFEFVKFDQNCHVMRFPWKQGVTLARIVDFDVTPMNVLLNYVVAFLNKVNVQRNKF